MEFEYRCEENIFALHHALKSKSYRHGRYTGFFVNDPKQRHIHKACVDDRILHHAAFIVLNPIFEETFIYDSYSCRKNKGTHRGINRLRHLLRKAGCGRQLPLFILKCDIRKFFQSVDHGILISLIRRRIDDGEALWLIKEIVESFSPGLPLGNVTSQLFSNIYLNELDQFIKHTLKIPFYVRYTDDFVIIDGSREILGLWLGEIQGFLRQHLMLELHPKKVVLRKYNQGIDFLGYVQFPRHRILRTKTKRRILAKTARGISEQSLHSYLGVLSHANSFKLSQELKNLYWFSKEN